MSKQDQIKAQLPPEFDKVRHLYYKTIIHPENERLKNHIFIRSNSIVRKVVAFCLDLILNKKFPNVILSAISKNMDKVVFIAELIKRKLKGLSQQTSLDTLEFQEVYLPKEHAKEKEEFVVKRKATILSIILDYRDTIDTNHYGYQRPLPLNQVSTKNPRDYVLMVINEYKNKRRGRWPGEKVYRKRGGYNEEVVEKEEKKGNQWEENYEKEKYPQKKKKSYKNKKKDDYYDDQGYGNDNYYKKRGNYENYDDYDDGYYDDGYYNDDNYYNSGKKHSNYNQNKGYNNHKNNYKKKGKRDDYY